MTVCSVCKLKFSRNRVCIFFGRWIFVMKTNQIKAEIMVQVSHSNRDASVSLLFRRVTEQGYWAIRLVICAQKVYPKHWTIKIPHDPRKTKVGRFCERHYPLTSWQGRASDLCAFVIFLPQLISQLKSNSRQNISVSNEFTPKIKLQLFFFIYLIDFSSSE